MWIIFTSHLRLQRLRVLRLQACKLHRTVFFARNISFGHTFTYILPPFAANEQAYMCITFTFRLLPLLLRHGFIIVPPAAAHIDMKLSTKWWKRGYCDSILLQTAAHMWILFTFLRHSTPHRMIRQIHYKLCECISVLYIKLGFRKYLPCIICRKVTAWFMTIWTWLPNLYNGKYIQRELIGRLHRKTEE